MVRTFVGHATHTAEKGELVDVAFVDPSTQSWRAVPIEAGMKIWHGDPVFCGPDGRAETPERTPAAQERRSVTITPEGRQCIRAVLQEGLFDHTELIYKIVGDNRHEFTLRKQIWRKLMFKPEPIPYVKVDIYTEFHGERVQNIVDTYQFMSEKDSFGIMYPVKVVV